MRPTFFVERSDPDPDDSIRAELQCGSGEVIDRLA
jgi:hypothetical protein